MTKLPEVPNVGDFLVKKEQYWPSHQVGEISRVKEIDLKDRKIVLEYVLGSKGEVYNNVTCVVLAEELSWFHNISKAEEELPEEKEEPKITIQYPDYPEMGRKSPTWHEKDKVQVALEELKKELKTTDFKKSINIAVEDFYRLRTEAQNLVIALEDKQKEKKPEIYMTANEHMGRGIEKVFEERGYKKQDIWKPVSELPIDDCTIIIQSENFYSYLKYKYEERNSYIMFRDKSLRYCTFSEFISEHNNMKERLERLEKLIK